ncbi:hypothetical protein ACEWY4_014169 [Coilia grayii]|uniref:Hemagglutinin/amebocyte aggregation factor n=1 Tax=Coilia grayii TaxID=363190 RepID=A0ABD1JRJ1_9TELE
MEKLTEIIEELAHRPVYEGPYEVALDDPASTNDTDMSNSKGKRAKRYANDFDGDLLFICPYGESFSRISSYHSDHHGDRRFSISCAPVVSSYTDCSQTNWVNHFDEAFTYTCPRNFVIAGMGSFHSNNHEDRRFHFRCCGGSTLSYSNCQWTPYVNCFDEYFEWLVPFHNYLAGVSSYHDNYRADRRFRFYICS